ncbi:MAG: hypothetical protein ABL901_03095 [Hyphomicrobiaceae bacterium]
MARKPTTWTLQWTHPVTGTRVDIVIRHTRDYLLQGTDHIEIETVKPKKAALPITATGYLSHFIDRTALRDAGGALQFVTSWLAREQRSKDWLKRDAAQRQADLFQWADAQAEVAQRKLKVSPMPATAKTRKRRAPSRDNG